MSGKIFIAMIIISVAGCENGNPIAPVQDAPQYLPLAAGNTWTFDNTTNYSGHDTTTPLVVDLEGPYSYSGLKWFGVNNFCVWVRTNNVSMNPLPLFCALWARDSNKILSQQNGPGPSLLFEEVMLDFPLSVGKEWTNRFVDTTYITGGDTVHFINSIKRTVTDVENIQVPAGMFMNCFHITDNTISFSETRSAVRYYSYSSHTVADEWYGRNVGMVKQNITVTTKSSDTSPQTYYQKRALRTFDLKNTN